MTVTDALADILSLRRRRLSEAKERTSMSAMERMAKTAPEVDVRVLKPGERLEL